MSIMRVIVILVSLVIVASCATPVGQLKSNDMAWTKLEMEMNYQSVFRNVKEGFRKCGSHFFADGNLYTDIKEGHFDIYLTDIFGGKSPWVYGVVNIKNIDSSYSALEIGVNNTYDNPVFGKKGGGREMIAKWASRIYACGQEKGHNKPN